MVHNWLKFNVEHINRSTESCPRAPSIITGSTKRGAVIVPNFPWHPVLGPIYGNWTMGRFDSICHRACQLAGYYLAFRGFSFLTFAFFWQAKQWKIDAALWLFGMQRAQRTHYINMYVCMYIRITQNRNRNRNRQSPKVMLKNIFHLLFGHCWSCS